MVGPFFEILILGLRKFDESPYYLGPVHTRYVGEALLQSISEIPAPNFPPCSEFGVKRYQRSKEAQDKAIHPKFGR